MSVRIVAVSDRPELAPTVAAWLVAEFHQQPGMKTVAEMTALILSPPVGPEETFVLFEGATPVGTASLAHKDLIARPDLTPWLAGVVVEAAHRGRGYGTALVRRVEDFAVASAVPALWLYTWTAEALYERLGWQRVGIEVNRGHDVVLMRRQLAGC